MPLTEASHAPCPGPDYNRGMAYRHTSLACLALWLVGARPASACSPGSLAAPTALPRTGATNVSTATSIVVLSPSEPFGLELKVDGVSMSVPRWTSLGTGYDGTVGWTKYWRLQLDGSQLAAESTYELSLPAGQADGGVAPLTFFATASGYDKAAGTAPTLREVRLWRVRYPVNEIGSGNCVSSEYMGFITIDYDPAVIPNTEPASVIHTFSLAPKTGGTTQSLVFTSATPYAGWAPEGDYHPPSFTTWEPDLDPSREYCLSISAFGDGDLARQTPPSATVCAKVTEVAAPGASLGGGCDIGGGASGVGLAGPIPLLVWLWLRRAARLSTGRRGVTARA
jgi:hypothetical protein